MRRLQFVACSLVLGLAACGGDGGGSSPSPTPVGTSTNTGTNTNPPANTFPPQVALTYAGATTAASVSATTAGAISANVVGAVGDTSSATGEQPTGAVGVTRRLATAMRSSGLTTMTTCDSGTIQVSGSLGSNGTGTVNVAFNACRTGSDTVNGPATLRIDGYDRAHSVITDGTLTMTRIDFSGPGTNIGFTGTLRTQIDTSAQTERLTASFVAQDNGTQHQTRVDNLSIADHFDNVLAKTFYTESISGRVYDAAAGFVDVSTQTAPFTSPWGPLYFSTATQSMPDWGIVTLAGATGSVKITSFGDMAKLEVDTNGDGTIDHVARMQWSAFNTAIGADLADSDGDGMHNSFETFYGLNKNSAADKDTDGDGDGASNYTEYLAGSNPSTNGSVPSPVRHLWVTGNRDLAVDASGEIQVFVGATGSGLLLDPVTRELGAAFSGVTEPNTGAQTSVTDAQGRTFTLTATAVPTSWTITSSTGATFTLTGVAGTDPGSLIRYGAHGLAFRTMGASGAGYIYLVESTALVP